MYERCEGGISLLKRYLEIEHVEGLTYRIVKQTYTGYHFFPCKDERFIASNGFILHSSSYPELQGKRTLACRGFTTLRHLREFTFRDELHLSDCLQAIREYNGEPKTLCICKSAVMCDYCFKKPKEALAF